MQAHKQREEMIKNMQPITKELLKAFYFKTKAKPVCAPAPPSLCQLWFAPSPCASISFARLGLA